MSLRLVKVPDAAPPYDCPTHGAGCPAMAAASAPGMTSVSASAPGMTSVSASAPGAASAPAPAHRAASAPAPVAGPAGALPWQFAQVMVEIMAGLRPQKQIIGLTTDHAREQARRLAPLLASDRRPAIRRIMTSRPAPRVVEMTVIVRIGPRSRALAMRLEHIAARPATPGRPARPDRWLCTAIEAG
jgi:UDP:flavonoid glycosyltransferase YjiC (YdhE family)